MKHRFYGSCRVNASHGVPCTRLKSGPMNKHIVKHHDSVWFGIGLVGFPLNASLEFWISCNICLTSWCPEPVQVRTHAKTHRETAASNSRNSRTNTVRESNSYVKRVGVCEPMRDPNTTPTKLSWARFFHLGLVRSLLNSPLPVQVQTIEQTYRETYREHTSTHFFWLKPVPGTHSTRAPTV